MKRERLGSRLGFILLSAGCAIGVGNVWKFPWLAGQNGGGGFVLIYALLLLFLYQYAKKVERSAALNQKNFRSDQSMDKALLCFGAIVGAGIVLVLSSSFITALQDYTMIIVALMFLIAGIGASILAGMKGKELASAFIKGMGGIFPAVLLILMASSIKYTLTEAKILDTLLYRAELMAGGMSKAGVVLFIYAICLVMNFFIASGSAKAFLLIPIIAPLAQLFGINMQLAIVAFAFGDGFSNVIYPTNAVLLITLGISDVSYGKWFRYSWKVQLLNLILTSAILMFGLAVGY